VPVPSARRANLILRLLQFGFYQLGASWAGFSKRFDLALVANPALWVGMPFAALVALRGKNAIMFIHDVYPDVGIKLGVFHHRPVIAAIAGLERFCLSRSTLIRISSNSFKPQLNALGVPDSKMELVYDWVDTELIHPLPRDNKFARENGLSSRFVVLYAGNIGLSQGLEHLLSAAEQLMDHKDLLFLFVGDGAGREQLVMNARQKNLENVKFLPFQARPRLPEVLASADISVVSLRQGIGTESLPSKTFSILASGRPVIACVDEKSDTQEIIQMADAGICVPPANTPDLVRAILKLKGDEELRSRMGYNGRRWAQIHHSPDSAAEQFERLMEKAISARFLKETKFGGGGLRKAK
jgi:colanic acid biosynthesis glycosyl transferase WcaI